MLDVAKDTVYRGPVRSAIRHSGLHPALSRTYWNVRTRLNSPYEFTVADQTLLLDVETPNELRFAESPVQSERPFVRDFYEHVQPGDLVFDIGAGYGHYALLAASRSDSTRAVAFEPRSEFIEKIRRNQELNDVTVDIKTGMVTGPDQRLPLDLMDIDDPGHESFEQVAERVGVPDVVKIDVSWGMELDIVKGMEQLIRDGSIRHVFYELHPKQLGDYDLREWGLRKPQLNELNSVFWNNEYELECVHVRSDPEQPFYRASRM